MPGDTFVTDILKTSASPVALDVGNVAVSSTPDCAALPVQPESQAVDTEAAFSSGPFQSGTSVLKTMAPRPPPGRIADDFVDGIAATTLEIFGEDTQQNRRKIYRQLSEIPPEQRLHGLIKVGGRVCCVPSLVRADLERRAREAVLPKETGVGELTG